MRRAIREAAPGCAHALAPRSRPSVAAAPDRKEYVRRRPPHRRAARKIRRAHRRADRAVAGGTTASCVRRHARTLRPARRPPRPLRLPSRLARAPARRDEAAGPSAPLHARTTSRPSRDKTNGIDSSRCAAHLPTVARSARPAKRSQLNPRATDSTAPSAECLAASASATSEQEGARPRTRFRGFPEAAPARDRIRLRAQRFAARPGTSNKSTITLAAGSITSPCVAQTPRPSARRARITPPHERGCVLRPGRTAATLTLLAVPTKMVRACASKRHRQRRRCRRPRRRRRTILARAAESAPARTSTRAARQRSRAPDCAGCPSRSDRRSASLRRGPTSCIAFGRVCPTRREMVGPHAGNERATARARFARRSPLHRDRW